MTLENRATAKKKLPSVSLAAIQRRADKTAAAGKFIIAARCEKVKKKGTAYEQYQANDCDRLHRRICRLTGPKPRNIRKETTVYDAAAIAAARTLGISLTAHIRQRYEQGGYHVLTISKESCRQITVDIGALYQSATQDTETGCNAE